MSTFSQREERILDALGNPVRRQIVNLIAHTPKPVGEIATTLPVSRPAVSKHLRILERAELVSHESKGNRNVFRLNQSGFEAAKRWLDSFWNTTLNQFATIAETTYKEQR